MKKFLICDDEPFYLEKVKRLAEENLKKAGVEDVQIDTVASGRELLEKEGLLADCQVVFLDINMDDCNGVEIAFEVKQKNPDILLVFVTAYMDYVLAGYRAEAFRFLLKDDVGAMMRECISALLVKIDKVSASICLEFSDGERNIRVNHIMYIESFGHKLYFHMSGEKKKRHEMYGNLSDLEKRLKEYGFCRVHKSFLVNMQFAESIRRYWLTLVNGQEIPIPKDKFQWVRKEYMKAVEEI